MKEFRQEAAKIMMDRFGKDTVISLGTLFSHGTRYDIDFFGN